MGHSVIISYTCNEQTTVISVSISLNIYHFMTDKGSWWFMFTTGKNNSKIYFLLTLNQKPLRIWMHNIVLVLGVRLVKTSAAEIWLRNTWRRVCVPQLGCHCRDKTPWPKTVWERKKFHLTGHALYILGRFSRLTVANCWDMSTWGSPVSLVQLC